MNLQILDNQKYYAGGLIELSYNGCVYLAEMYQKHGKLRVSSLGQPACPDDMLDAVVILIENLDGFMQSDEILLETQLILDLCYCGEGYLPGWDDTEARRLIRDYVAKMEERQCAR